MFWLCTTLLVLQGKPSLQEWSRSEAKRNLTQGKTIRTFVCLDGDVPAVCMKCSQYGLVGQYAIRPILIYATVNNDTDVCSSAVSSYPGDNTECCMHDRECFMPVTDTMFLTPFTYYCAKRSSCYYALEREEIGLLKQQTLKYCGSSRGILVVHYECTSVLDPPVSVDAKTLKLDYDYCIAYRLYGGVSDGYYTGGDLYDGFEELHKERNFLGLSGQAMWIAFSVGGIVTICAIMLVCRCFLRLRRNRMRAIGKHRLRYPHSLETFVTSASSKASRKTKEDVSVLSVKTESVRDGGKGTQEQTAPVESVTSDAVTEKTDVQVLGETSTLQTETENKGYDEEASKTVTLQANSEMKDLKEHTEICRPTQKIKLSNDETDKNSETRTNNL